MKLDWFTLEENDRWARLSDGTWIEPWDQFSPEHKAYATGWAWDRWVIASCVESTGGHQWYLDLDPEDGLDLHCQHCPAGIDELYPDGNDLIFAELPLADGQTVKIDYGGVALDAEAQEWHGPVKAWVHSEQHYSWEYGGYEYDAWVIVEAA